MPRCANVGTEHLYSNEKSDPFQEATLNENAEQRSTKRLDLSRLLDPREPVSFTACMNAFLNYRKKRAHSLGG